MERWGEGYLGHRDSIVRQSITVSNNGYLCYSLVSTKTEVRAVETKPVWKGKNTHAKESQLLSLFCHSPKTFAISELSELLYTKRSPDFFLTTNTATKFF
jgi:hypothetical protein